MNIYVGNLSRTVTEDALRKLFSGYGEVTSAKVMVDKFTGEPRGFGFIVMPNDEEANQAMTALNGQELEGSRLRVNEARPPVQREGNAGGFGGDRGGFRSPRSGGFSPRGGGDRDRGGFNRGGSSRY